MVEVNILYKKKETGREVGLVFAKARVKSDGDRIYSYDLGLKTILDLVATPEYNPSVGGVFITKQVMNPGQYDNYASVWAWVDSSTPESTVGSVWINLIALGQ